MELRHLQYFLAIANEGSFLGAAKHLHLTQPTLSRQIKELEDELGKPLFIRGSRHVTLTKHGVYFKVRVEEILSLLNKTTHELIDQDGELSGEIYIGAGETAGFSIIANVIKKLQEKHPKIKVNVYSGDYDDILDRLEKGLIDFGLLISNAQLEKYQHITLPYQDMGGLLIRKDDPLSHKEFITRQEIAHLPLLISRQPSSVEMIQNWAQLETKDLNIIGTYNLIYNASVLVKEKVGYSFALANLVDVSDTSELCFRPFNPTLSANLFLIWKDYIPFSKVAQAFLTELKNEINR